MTCKGAIEKKDWRVLKCGNARCEAAAIHFSCLGFIGSLKVLHDLSLICFIFLRCDCQTCHHDEK